MDTILILEDMMGVRRVFAAILQGAGYGVLEAATADEALFVQRQRQEPIHLLIANVLVPDRCSGTQAALELRAAHPELRVLLIGNTPSNRWTGSALKDVWRLPGGSYSILARPFTKDRLEQKVRELLGGTGSITA